MAHDKDWIEGLRRYWYPLIHRLLEPFGLYATGRVYNNQYIGSVRMDEEALEYVFHQAGVERNAAAAYKIHGDGRKSEGSWRITHHTHPSYVEHGRQVHFTLFRNRQNPDFIDIYAHWEDDYVHDPFGHVAASNFDPQRGVRVGREFLDARTDLDIINFYEKGGD